MVANPLVAKRTFCPVCDSPWTGALGAPGRRDSEPMSSGWSARFAGSVRITRSYSVRTACLAISKTSRTIIIGFARAWACRRTRPGRARPKRQKPGGSSQSPDVVGSIIVANGSRATDMDWGLPTFSQTVIQITFLTPVGIRCHRTNPDQADKGETPRCVFDYSRQPVREF